MTIYCIEQNYFARRSDTYTSLFDEPEIFVKTHDALWQQILPFNLPSINADFYGACELVLRISKEGKNILEEYAPDYYESITIGINFVAINDSLKNTGNWNEMKGWPNSSVVGKWMSTSVINTKNDIDFCLYQNRQLLQMGNSEFMIDGLDKIVTLVSNKFFLKEGDIIFTGCPSPGSEIFSGDKLEAFINDDSLLEFDVE